jgi:phage terminase small subunit
MSSGYSTPEYLAKLAAKEPAADYPTAERLYQNMVDWLTQQGCLDLVAPVLIENYCLNQRAYLECESMNRQLGRAAKAANGIDLSPYVEAALKYGAAAQKALFEIQNIVTQSKTAKRKEQETVKCWKL